MELLENKVALITGAGRGIGKAIALRFAQEGCNIAFTDIALNDVVLETEKELQALGVKVKAYASNAANFEETHQVVDEIVKDFGRIDILVNNAGITKDTALKRMTEEQWDAVINVNLKSVFNFTKAVQPVMWKQNGGSVINMSSVVGVSGNANQCNYSASKAGIIGFTKSAAKEMGVRNIRHNAIAPGFIITAMTNALPEEVRKTWESLIPLRRGGTPEDVANVALFLASDLSSYVTGQVIHCCGGMNC
ncbi:MAG: 3-oxoacyl-[acyl-carrier-protein] reductase [Bacteroidales bacterium]|nr:3-oxoacyl-[acyl-carrier-protein] reductase [Bacteroidales bacterium]